MVVASIDLMNGKAVQLKQGNEKVLEKDNPLELAKEFDKYGEIAVIDLDAALGQGDNFNIIKDILKIGEVRVGGGIHSIDKAKELISLGAKKIIIGSKAFENDKLNIKFLNELKSAIGRNNIIIAIDAIKREIVTKGWKHKTGIDLYFAAKELESYCSEYLFTCVEKEGMMQGTDHETIKELINTTKNKITVAGGVNSVSEILTLNQLGTDVQLGMALYKGDVSLSDAFIECLNWKNDLLPTITNNEEGQVLMLAYSNKDSLKEAFKNNKMTYFSRSKNRLWTKGESSNHFQEIIRMRTDCDKDSILCTVKQSGVACHTGSYSCFGDKSFSLFELYDVLKDRIDNPKPGSYTAKLDDKLLREKIMEEAEEVCEAKTKDEVIWEAADVIYFLTVLMAKNNVTYNDVIAELKRRRR